MASFVASSVNMRTSLLKCKSSRSNAFNARVAIKSAGKLSKSCHAMWTCAAASFEEDKALSKEWSTSYSQAYEDIVENLKPLLFLPEANPEAKVGELMSKSLTVVAPSDVLSAISSKFTNVSGMPVMNGSECVGVISKKDLGDDLSKTVADVMSSPAVLISSNNKVAAAAALMLKHKIHRIPVVDAGKVVGMVTRKDIFTALGQTV